MRFLKGYASVLILATALSVQAIQPTQALTVFDPANYSQNLLTAARNLQQIQNQVTSLQNQAQSLINQAKNLQNLPKSFSGDLLSSLNQLDGLFNQANGIAYQVTAIEDAFRDLYPDAYPSSVTGSKLIQDARQAWFNARSGYQHAMQVQASVLGQIQSDTSLLDKLVASSQGAVGALQVAQAGNQLTAFSAKQNMQLQKLLIASERARALDRARELAATEQARARYQNFLGDRSPYTR